MLNVVSYNEYGARVIDGVLTLYSFISDDRSDLYWLTVLLRTEQGENGNMQSEKKKYEYWNPAVL